MNQEKGNKPGDRSILSYFNLSSHYERKARLLPGLLCAMSLLPLAAAFGTPLGHWLELAATGLGLWAVCGVGISHLSSAAGNRLQRKLWPRWPYDAPTNQWLHPENTTKSAQQKQLMYKAIKRLTSLDIQSAAKQGPGELEAVINDAVSRLRYRLVGSAQAMRLDVHNADYGFARNIAGLRAVWLSLLALSVAGCWLGYFRFGSALSWALIASALLVMGIPLAMGSTQYVRERPWHHAESFFSSVLELDRVQEQDKSPKTQEAQVKKQPTGRSTRKKADEPEKK